MSNKKDILQNEQLKKDHFHEVKNPEPEICSNCKGWGYTFYTSPSTGETDQELCVVCEGEGTL